jgi:dienelactone hydrolase
MSRRSIFVATTKCAARVALAMAFAGLPATFQPVIAAATKVLQVAFPGNGVTLKGWVYAPTQSGQHPAVVAMHGCSGLTDDNGMPSKRHQDWGERLSGLGFVVLFPDGFGSRGLGPQCRVGDRDVRPSHERVDDALASLAYLSTQPNVKPQAISLLGWSNGGSTVLYSVEPKHAPRAGVDFAKAVAFYPGCRVPLETGQWRTRLPLLILIGQADDWTAAAPCVDLSKNARSNGLSVDIVTYPNAYHDFDHPSLPVHTIDGLAFTSSGTGHAHTGTDPAARADAIARVPTFLAK